jgi:hypothetical protein
MVGRAWQPGSRKRHQRPGITFKGMPPTAYFLYGGTTHQRFPTPQIVLPIEEHISLWEIFCIQTIPIE